jgi:hypothetical protein
MARTTDQAHTRLDLLEPRVTKIETTVHIQFKEVFARIKRLEAILIGANCCYHCIVDKHHTDNAIKGCNPMTPKNLQIDSKFNQFDVDGDGVVSDEELSRSERMIQIDNNDKMQDQQRLMAWAAMLSSILTVAALLTPLVAVERMNSAAAFLNTFLVAQTGIVVGFMGATAWSKSKENK